MAARQYPQHRGVVMARGGMIASAHPLVTATGLRILRAGGSAADAAIAAAAVCGVTLCGSNSIGGDMFCLYYDAATRRITGFNGNGPAGSGATVEELRRRGYRHMPPRGPVTVTVPGAVHGYWELHSRFGRLPWRQLFDDAIHYAEHGHPVHERTASGIASAAAELSGETPWAEIYTPHGRAPKPGELLIQRDYAWSLRQVAEGGRDAFYRGEIARRIAAYLRERGGFVTEADLAAHTTEVYEPISTTYRGLTIHETRPPSQGFILLEMLNLIEPDDLRGMGFGSAAAIHRMVEAKKLAFADRIASMGDPRYVDAPTDELISKRYAAARRRALDPERAATTVPAGMPRAVPADTTSFVVVDGAGNAASFIHTLYSSFGSGVTVPGTGIVLTNRGYAFALDEAHPNAIAPGKRTMHTLNTYIGTDGDELVLVGNTPGGDNQVQWNTQVLTNLLDFDMNVQQAAEAPTWISTPGSQPDSWDLAYELQLEPGFDPAEVAKLEAMGHRVRVMPGHLGSRIQLIRRDPASGVLFGGSDPRAEGMAAGY
jgi:gamma-glutamyltranspeptidase/glutathione hydrolase